MENKELINEVLNSMKEFKIIAYKSDEEIANKIINVIKTELMLGIDEIGSRLKIDEWSTNEVVQIIEQHLS